MEPLRKEGLRGEHQLSVFATPIGQLMPLGPWLQYPYGFFASDKYCWRLRDMSEIVTPRFVVPRRDMR